MIGIAINIVIKITIVILEDFFPLEVNLFYIYELLFCELTIILDSKPDLK